MELDHKTHKVSDEVIESITSNSSTDKKMSRNKLGIQVVIIPDTNELKYIVPVEYKGSNFGAFLSSPEKLFLFQANEFSKLSEEIKKTFPMQITISLEQDSDSQPFMSLVNDSVYNEYIGLKISSIALLMMSVESFINTLIPESFEAENSRKAIVGKLEIERHWKLKDKIKDVVPRVKILEDMEEYQNLYSKVIEISLLRNEFVHLKTKSNEKGIDPYLKHFESIVSLNLETAIKDVERLFDYIIEKEDVC